MRDGEVKSSKVKSMGMRDGMEWVGKGIGFKF